VHKNTAFFLIIVSPRGVVISCWGVVWWGVLSVAYSVMLVERFIAFVVIIYTLLGLFCKCVRQNIAAVLANWSVLGWWVDVSNNRKALPTTFFAIVVIYWRAVGGGMGVGNAWQ
jgi:hypothetical protein